ncbi:unnamed protein product, partial [Closterium sp. Yama58-4]
VDARTDEGRIKKRYRQLALLLHPDKNKSQKAEAAFRYVKEAHTILTDSNKRAVFDTLRARLPPCPCTAPAGGRAMGVQRGAGGFRASQGASWAGNEAGRLQELREQAKARVVSLEREWEEKKEQWLRDFEQAKAQQQAQQQQEQQEQAGQAEGESDERAEADGEQEGEEETDVANGRRGDEESEGGVSEGSVSEKGASGEGANEGGVRDAAAAPASQRATCGGSSHENPETGIFEENSDHVGDSIWEQLADLVDDADMEGADVEGADVESEGKGRRESSSWSCRSGAEEDRDAQQAEERKEGREKLAEQTAEERKEEQSDETVEVNLSSPDMHGRGKGSRQMEGEGDKEGGRVADAGMERAGSMMSSASSDSFGNASADTAHLTGSTLAAARASPSSSASGSTGDLPTSFRATTSGRAAADAMAAAAAATEAARKVLERSRSVLRKGSAFPEGDCGRADGAGGTGSAGKKDSEGEVDRVEWSAVRCGAETEGPSSEGSAGEGSVGEDLAGASTGSKDGGSSRGSARHEADRAADDKLRDADALNHLPSSTASASAPASSDSCSSSGLGSVGRSPGAESPISSTFSRSVSSRGGASHSSLGNTWVTPCSSGGGGTSGSSAVDKEGKEGRESRESREGKEGVEGKEGSDDVLETLLRLRRDTQAVAASLDNLRLRLSARPAAVFPAADFPGVAAGSVPGVTGSPPVQVPAS